MDVIVAADRGWGIGRGGDQLCYLPEDLKRFRALTLGHPVILGRKTLATFPGGRPLKGRRNLILSRDPSLRVEGADVIFTVSDNGVGMDAEQIEAILRKERSDHTGIGIKNVNDRLKIYFGEGYGITIHSEPDEGTVVTIRMPQVREEGEYENR